MARGVGPYFLGEHDSEFFQTFNRNKKSLTLDLKHKRGREVFEKLVATADGVFGNMRGDQPEKLRLRCADLCAREVPGDQGIEARFRQHRLFL